MLGSTTIRKIEQQLRADLIDELSQQGHYLTGALEASIQSIIEEGKTIALEMSASRYIDPLNTGVPPENIPYDSSRKSGAKTSKYIQALKNYSMLRFGVDEKEALTIAFKIAKKHEKEGMPTQGSYAFSKNSRRTTAIESTYNENESKYESIIENTFSGELDILIDQTFPETVI